MNHRKETTMATDTTTEAVTESAEDLAKRFAALAATWREDTKFSSRPGRDAQHPAYQEIIAMGEKAVPLLLADLEKDPDHWFIALYRITGANPVPDEHAGKLKEMAAAWIAWGRAHGYRWERAI
jgi:hypothetical protein